MLRANYTAEAERDLAQITHRIVQDNLLAALDWLEKLRTVCELLATQPALGQTMRTRQFGDVRRQVFGDYLIYYEPTPQGIDILRIVHGARDQDRLL
jgi:toxin ParE1/3/4